MATKLMPQLVTHDFPNNTSKEIMVFPICFPWIFQPLAEAHPSRTWARKVQCEEFEADPSWVQRGTPRSQSSSSPHRWPNKNHAILDAILVLETDVVTWGLTLESPFFLSETYSEAIRQTALDEIIKVSGFGFIVQKEWQKSRAKEQPSVDPQRTQKRINK